MDTVQFNEIESIFNALPEHQQKWVAPRGYMVDSPNLLYRHITPDKEGFVELYKSPDEEDKAFLTLAVRPESQGKGVGKKLLTKAIAEAKLRDDIKSIIYRAANTNEGSSKLVSKFTNNPRYVGDTHTEWEIDAGLGDVSADKESAIRQVLSAYKKKYGIDMSDIKFIEDPIPRFNNGKKVPKKAGIVPGGSWTKSKRVYLAPDMQPAMDIYGVDEDKTKFLKRIIAHELGHEVWYRHADDGFKRRVKEMISRYKFSTPYLESVPANKKDEEGFAEYMASQILKEASGKIMHVKAVGCKLSDGSVRDVDAYMPDCPSYRSILATGDKEAVGKLICKFDLHLNSSLRIIDYNKLIYNN